MRILTKTIMASTIALCMGNVSADLYYSQTIFFGDSLTDSGAYAGNADAGAGSSFTTDPGNVWSENLAEQLGTSAVANNPNNPATDPTGTNYAQGGAQVATPVGIGTTASPQSALPISTQIENYLTSTGGAADPDALYTVWGGANDVFFNMALVGGSTPTMLAIDNMAISADQMAGLVQQLASAGAQTIIVPNLPDTGATPSSVLSTINTAGAGNANLDNALAAAVFELAQLGDGQELNALAAAEQILGLPAGVLTQGYEQTSALSSGLSAAYNAALAASLSQVDANIVMLDTQQLFSEIIANPTEFLLGNTSGVACVTSSALPCTADTLIDPITPSVFLFADSVHPTTAGHQIFADYAFSVLNAPALVSALPQATHGMLRNHQSTIGNHLHGLSSTEEWQVFGDFSLNKQDVDGSNIAQADTTDTHFSIGAAKQISDSLVVGAALDKVTSNADFSSNQGSYDLDATNLSLFAGFSQQSTYAHLIATLGVQGDYDIDRTVNFGGSSRVENGTTDGDMRAIKLEVGTSVYHSNGFSFGPFGSLAHQSVDVDGFSENPLCAPGSATTAPCSTPMIFGDQSVDSLMGEVGVFLHKNTDSSQFSAELSYAKELDDDGRSLEAGLVSTGSTFSMDNIESEDHSIKLELSYRKQMTKNIQLSVGYRLRKGDDSNSHALNAGVDVSF